MDLGDHVEVLGRGGYFVFRQGVIFRGGYSKAEVHILEARFAMNVRDGEVGWGLVHGDLVHTSSKH